MHFSIDSSTTIKRSRIDGQSSPSFIDQRSREKHSLAQLSYHVSWLNSKFRSKQGYAINFSAAVFPKTPESWTGLRSIASVYRSSVQSCTNKQRSFQRHLHLCYLVQHCLFKPFGYTTPASSSSLEAQKLKSNNTSSSTRTSCFFETWRTYVRPNWSIEHHGVGNRVGSHSG